MALQKVDLNKAYRLINHGPTLIICASHEGVVDAMSASWVCPLDYDKVTAVVASGSFTRSLFEKSGKFGLCVPFFKDTALITRLGTTSMHSDKNKLAGVEMFYENGVPLLKECAAYMVCEIIEDAKNESEFDLFKAKVVAAYADTRVFEGGHWKFENLDDELKTPHYIAGGQFYADGAAKFEEKAAIIG